MELLVSVKHWNPRVLGMDDDGQGDKVGTGKSPGSSAGRIAGQIAGRIVVHRYVAAAAAAANSKCCWCLTSGPACECIKKHGISMQGVL